LTKARWAGFSLALPVGQRCVSHFELGMMGKEVGFFFKKAILSIAFGVSFNLNLQSQCQWSLFNKMWQKRRKGLKRCL